MIAPADSPSLHPGRLEPRQAYVVVYYLAWRVRPDRPWQSEELLARSAAHDRYLELRMRGWEAHLETRRKPQPV